ncbi:MAG: TfoX/Sxy family protein [Bacteroidota bacterium]
MAEPAGVETLPNLGPTSASMIREVGIETADDLREAGAVLAYKILQHRFGRQRVNALFLFAMEGALIGRHYNDFSPEEKAALREAASGDLTIGRADDSHGSG